MKIRNLNPKVSVLIANYNNSIYLDRCINSVLNQSYKNKEIIFVDDKSSDDSIQVVKKYLKKIKIIKIKKKIGIESLDQNDGIEYLFSGHKDYGSRFPDDENTFLGGLAIKFTIDDCPFILMDINQDDIINVVDVVSIVNYIRFYFFASPNRNCRLCNY